jgi:hypothetical protein
MRMRTTTPLSDDLHNNTLTTTPTAFILDNGVSSLFSFSFRYPSCNHGGVEGRSVSFFGMRALFCTDATRYLLMHSSEFHGGFFDFIAMSRYQFDCFPRFYSFSDASCFGWLVRFSVISGGWEDIDSDIIGFVEEQGRTLYKQIRGRR